MTRRAPSAPPTVSPERAGNRTAVQAAAAAADLASAASWAAAAAQEAADRAEDAARATPAAQPTTTTTPAALGVQTVQRTVRISPWPPLADHEGRKFWYVRQFPKLPDGIYTTEALTNRGVDPGYPRAAGLITGWKTSEPVLRKSYETGLETDTIFWR